MTLLVLLLPFLGGISPPSILRHLVPLALKGTSELPLDAAILAGGTQATRDRVYANRKIRKELVRRFCVVGA
jgi:hypothetical protein